MVPLITTSPIALTLGRYNAGVQLLGQTHDVGALVVKLTYWTTGACRVAEVFYRVWCQSEDWWWQGLAFRLEFTWV